MKPQLLLFCGLFLLCSRSFMTIGIGVVLTAILVGLTTLMIGIEPWRLLFFKNGPDQTAAMFEIWTLQPYVMTWYAVAYRFTVDEWISIAVQAVPTIISLVLCVLVSLSRRDTREKMDLVLVLMALGLPYLLVYDLILLLPVTMRIMIERERFTFAHRVAAYIVTFGGILSIFLMIIIYFPLLQAAIVVLMIFQLLRFFKLPDVNCGNQGINLSKRRVEPAPAR